MQRRCWQGKEGSERGDDLWRGWGAPKNRAISSPSKSKLSGNIISFFHQKIKGQYGSWLFCPLILVWSAGGQQRWVSITVLQDKRPFLNVFSLSFSICDSPRFNAPAVVEKQLVHAVCLSLLLTLLTHTHTNQHSSTELCRIRLLWTCALTCVLLTVGAEWTDGAESVTPYRWKPDIPHSPTNKHYREPLLAVATMRSTY